jgi:DNA/RNA-binding domain of Phe-tRNA-synthetase-like protein
MHASLDEWANAYEDLADKTARAGKRPARERMTVLKELRVLNEDNIQRIDPVMRIRHTASYSQRIKALGAAQ